jgi:Domain of unknown function (DUF3883)
VWYTPPAPPDLGPSRRGGSAPPDLREVISGPLTTFEESDPTGSRRGGGGSGKGRYAGERQMTDAQRSAMGLASEWLAYHFLLRRYPEYVNEGSWVSGNRVHFFGGEEGDDSAGYDFLVRTPQADWLYEVKSSLEDSAEFELTANELRVASSAWRDGRRRYRILYVPYTFSPDRWFVLELPNPMGERSRRLHARLDDASYAVDTLPSLTSSSSFQRNEENAFARDSKIAATLSLEKGSANNNALRCLRKLAR